VPLEQPDRSLCDAHGPWTDNLVDGFTGVWREDAKSFSNNSNFWLWLKKMGWSTIGRTMLANAPEKSFALFFNERRTIMYNPPLFDHAIFRQICKLTGAPDNLVYVSTGEKFTFTDITGVTLQVSVHPLSSPSTGTSPADAADAMCGDAVEPFDAQLSQGEVGFVVRKSGTPDGGKHSYEGEWFSILAADKKSYRIAARNTFTRLKDGKRYQCPWTNVLWRMSNVDDEKRILSEQRKLQKKHLNQTIYVQKLILIMQYDSSFAPDKSMI